MNTDDLRVYHEILRMMKKGQGKDIADTLGLTEPQIDQMMKTTVDDVNGPKAEEPKPKEQQRHGYHLVIHSTSDDDGYDGCEFDIKFFPDTDDDTTELIDAIKKARNQGAGCYLFLGSNIPYTEVSETVTKIKIP